MRYRLIVFAIFGAALIGIGEWNLRNRELGPLQTLNDAWLDFCVGNSGKKIRNPAVTLVRIDDDFKPLSIGGDPQTAPKDGSAPNLTRLDFATILAFVGKQGARGVSFVPTPTFDKENVLNQEAIEPLRDAALSLPRLTLGAVVAKKDQPGAAMEFPALKVEGEPGAVPEFNTVTKAPDKQLISNGDPAFTEIEAASPASDGNAIRVFLIAKQGDKIVPSFVLLSVARFAGINLDAITVDFTGKKPEIRIGDRFTVPIAADGSMEVPAFAGFKRSMTTEERDAEGKSKKKYHYTTLSVDELAYTGQQDDEVAKRILANFQGKFESVGNNLVVVGFEREVDQRIVTAAGETLSESSLLARAIATIQSGRYIGLWPSWARWVAVVAIVAIAVLLFRYPRRKVGVLGALATLIFFALCVMVFKTTLTWTPPFVMMSLFLLLLAVGLILPHQKKSSSDSAAEPVETGETAPETA